MRVGLGAERRSGVYIDRVRNHANARRRHARTSDQRLGDPPGDRGNAMRPRVEGPKDAPLERGALVLSELDLWHVLFVNDHSRPRASEEAGQHGHYVRVPEYCEDDVRLDAPDEPSQTEHDRRIAAAPAYQKPRHARRHVTLEDAPRPELGEEARQPLLGEGLQK